MNGLTFPYKVILISLIAVAWHAKANDNHEG